MLEAQGAEWGGERAFRAGEAQGAERGEERVYGAGEAQRTEKVYGAGEAQGVEGVHKEELGTERHRDAAAAHSTLCDCLSRHRQYCLPAAGLLP